MFSASDDTVHCINHDHNVWPGEPVLTRYAAYAIPYGISERHMTPLQ